MIVLRAVTILKKPLNPLPLMVRRYLAAMYIIDKKRMI